MVLCECAAKGCITEVPVKRVFCFRHWAMVPYHTQRRIWDTIKAGGVISEEFKAVLVEALEEVKARDYND